MNKPSMTKEERFLCKLYDLALAKGNVHLAMDQYVIGRAIGQNDKATIAITRQLAQANFIKKGEKDNTFFLSAQGIAFVEEL